MKDRYLFRGKRIDNGEWVQGFLSVHTFIPSEEEFEKSGKETYLAPVIESVPERIYDHDVHEVDPSTICQCTGLKDKNGKLIFENDILLQKTTEKHWCKWQRMGLLKYGKHDWNEGVYGYKNIGFFVEPIVKEGDETRMKPGLCQEDLVFENYPYEVIGNTFDNPELLEVQE